MALRRLFVGGNWKSNNTLQQSRELVQNVYNKLKFDATKVDVIAAPVFVHIPWVLENVQKSVQVAAQNTSATQFGAYTGEIAPKQIKDLGVNWTILGHSERRQFYGEDSAIVANKTKLALESGLRVIACIGEKIDDREAGRTNSVLESQLVPIGKALTDAQWAEVVIAYEPVWAIGTGKVATTQQAQDAHAFVRKWLQGISSKVSENTRIIYGGSVTEKNAGELISQKDVDGFLVGGASLKAGFIDIINATKK